MVEYGSEPFIKDFGHLRDPILIWAVELPLGMEYIRFGLNGNILGSQKQKKYSHASPKRAQSWDGGSSWQFLGSMRGRKLQGRLVVATHYAGNTQLQ